MEVARLVASWNPDFVLTLGNNNYLGPTNYDNVVGQFYHDFMYPYSGVFGVGATSNRFWPALGNHDWAYFGPPLPMQMSRHTWTTSACQAMNVITITVPGQSRYSPSIAKPLSPMG